MKYDYILVDISNIYHAAMSVSAHLTMETAEGTIVTGGVYSSLKTIQRVAKEYLAENGKMYFLFDNTSSVESRRKQIDPEYKANRYKKDPMFYRGLDYLNLILLSYENGWIVVRRPGSEADDLVAAALWGIPEESNVLLYSNDLDWSRAISDKVTWAKRDFAKHSDVLVTKESFKAEYGYTPTRESVCLYKSFRGDSSDNIAIGVERIPEKVLLHIVENYSSLPDLFRRLDDSSIPQNWRDAIREKKARLALNYSLIDFEHVDQEEFSAHSTETVFQPETLKRLYNVLGFQVTKIDPRIQKMDAPKTEESEFFEFTDYGRA